MKTLPPSKRQHDVLCFVADYTIAHGGLAPSQAEIGRKLGMSKATVFEHVAALVKKGLVTKTQGASRSIVPTQAGMGYLPADGGASEAERWRTVSGWLHTWAALDSGKTGRRIPDLEDLYRRTLSS